MQQKYDDRRLVLEKDLVSFASYIVDNKWLHSIVLENLQIAQIA
jgi:hypothetical protein